VVRGESAEPPEKIKSRSWKTTTGSKLARLAIGNDERFFVSDIEFGMPQPSYTIDTFTYLKEKQPHREFRIIMGADGLRNFDKWKNADVLTENYHRLVYPRPGVSKEEILSHKNITLVDAPMMDISSSFIRRAIRSEKDVRYFLPEKTYQYIRDMHFYER
jgi:nicotinate-nucleotide adenylyltransferase